MVCMQPLLKLKTRPKARPVSYSLSMLEGRKDKATIKATIFYRPIGHYSKTIASVYDDLFLNFCSNLFSGKTG